MRRYLDQEKVTEFAKLTAQLATLKKRHEKIRVRLIEAMAQGAVCPKSGPYIVELGETERTLVSWSKEWKKLAKKVFGPEWQKERNRTISRAGTQLIPTLYSKINYRKGEEGNVVEFKSKRNVA